jgi:tRNA(Ile)-lysidine synthase TilS/MesJ
MAQIDYVPVVSIVTSHGRQLLSAGADERLGDLLARNGVPWSAISAYAIPSSGGEPKLQPSLDRKLKDFSDTSEILLYFNRNVNPFMFSLTSYKTVESSDPGEEATEYFYQRLDNDQGTAEAFLKKLSAEECRSVIVDRVREVVYGSVPKETDLVVGVSGGGDSNALLYGLSQVKDHDLKIHPLIITGIPDWDAGVPRAEALCDTYGLDLTVVDEEGVKNLLGIPLDSIPLIDRFEREFKGDDFEFLGTLLIRLALIKKAEELDSRFICTGLNLEDILCEGLYRVSSGMKPAPIPIREIGSVTLVTPLWLCPKRIIDGCFPRYSLENYDARYPCFSLGRNLYYSMIYALQSQFPGFLEQLADGLSKLASTDPVAYEYDEQLGFHVERFVPFALRHRFDRMLGRSTIAADAEAASDG